MGLLSAGAFAEELSVEQIIETLRPPANSRMGIAVEAAAVDEKISHTVNLYVNFAYNSALLEQDARITLDRLAAALKDDRLVEWEFLIGGHTDAVGSDAYKLLHSERRAMAVEEYLVKMHGISEKRLIEKGFGESLLNVGEPADGVNCRVQVTTLALPAQ